MDLRRLLTRAARTQYGPVRNLQSATFDRSRSIDFRGLDRSLTLRARNMGVDFCAPNVVKRADVRMIQRSNGTRFALESLSQVGPVGKMRVKTLIATMRSRRVSLAL